MIRGCATGADVSTTRQCLIDLGIRIEGDHSTSVDGRGWSPIDKAELDCRNSGSTMRLLSGPLAGVSGTYRMTGDDSLSRRPMDRIAVPLRSMGAHVELQEDRYPPIVIHGGTLSGISYESPVASAQVKGALLLAGVFAEGQTVVKESRPTRDHTERLLEWLGGNVEIRGSSVGISGPFTAESFEIDVPGDVSSAAYWMAAAACLDGAEIQISSVGLNPTRTAFIDVLDKMGALVEIVSRSKGPEPSGEIIVRSSGSLQAVEIRPEQAPLVIDEIPLIALLATQANGTTKITGAEELRVKESDRISALIEPLRSLGAEVEELSDGMVINGPTELSGGTIDPKGDHRIALTMAIAGIIGKEPVRVLGWECADISYPGFLDDLAVLAR